MPSRNVTKQQSPDSYYHVYARGNCKQKIFIEDGDYKHFLKLFDRYLSEEPSVGNNGEIYPNFLEKIEVLAYCIMENHFHLLIYQIDIPNMEKLMRSIMTSYSRYFNLKYKRTGSVFEGRYRASRINDESYLDHISRYIHLNPRRWMGYKYSSLKYYINNIPPHWLNINKVLDLFSSKLKYLEFISDYVEKRDLLKEIKHKLSE